MQDFKNIRDRHAQKLKEKGVKPAAPVGGGNLGAMRGGFFPRMGPMGGTPHMGGHGGGHR